MESVSVIAVGESSRVGCKFVCGSPFLGCWVKVPGTEPVSGWIMPILELVGWSVAFGAKPDGGGDGIISLVTLTVVV